MISNDFKLIFNSSEALLSSITLLEGESYDASFVPRRSSSELVFFRGFGPRLEAWAAAVASGLVLAVLAMIHAAGAPRLKISFLELKR